MLLIKVEEREVVCVAQLFLLLAAMRSSKSGTALVPPLAKRVKIAHTSGSLDDDSDSDSDSGIESASTSASGSGSEVTETEDGIADAKSQKSKKTMKRKHRATEPSRFGATLEFLLATETPSTQPLSLRPSAAKKHNDEWLESKARRALQLEKKDKEDKGRITDVIGGWGGQSERALRKIAQRGGTNLLVERNEGLIVVQWFSFLMLFSNLKLQM